MSSFRVIRMIEKKKCRHHYLKSANQILFNRLFRQLLLRKSQLLMGKESPLLNVNIQRCTYQN